MALKNFELPVFSAHERREFHLDPVTKDYLHHLAENQFDGDIDDSYSGRLVAATDNSVYQQLPQAVLYPRTLQALQQALRLAQSDKFRNITFSARGGGTGTNGQSLTAGVVIDLSRYFNEIITVDAANRTVSCQAGVVKDALNDVVRPYGLFFSPDLSTSNRATIGGMINTDASGQGSLVYGKTSDHVLELTAVLYNGELLQTKPIPRTEAERIARGEGLIAAIYRQVLATCVGYRDAIVAKFPPLNRFLTGYDLKHCYNPSTDTIDLSRLLAGSEGTLAFICEAKLNLTVIPTHKVLVNVKYDDFFAALRHAPDLVKAQATSVETIDSHVLNLARQDIIWHQVSAHLHDIPERPMKGINMVEFTAQDLEQIEQKVHNLCAHLDQMIANTPQQGVIGYQICADEASIRTIYAMRKKSVGLLGATKGRRKPIAFTEDTAVPPEHLAAFIAEFRALLDQHELHYGMFGHVDAGVLHVRPALDMTDPDDEALLRTISDQVAQLTAKYGGLMWGEHGKGYRSEYAPQFFGEQLYAELQKIKAAFDPDNRMNPGKICTPWQSQAQLVSVDARKRGYYDRQIPIDVRESYQSAMDCNGNGLCFNYEHDSAMCPSFKISGDRRQSPKGRATLIREWLRLTQQPDTTISDAFNHEIKAAMDTCLACKACASQCPVKVDVPRFRSRFLAWYHARYRRPLKDYLLKHLERLTPALATVPRVSNWLTHNGFSRWLLQRGIGYYDAPQLSVPSLRKRWRRHNWLQLSAQQMAQLSVEQRQTMVVIVQDPFTSFYHAELVEAFGLLAKRLGFEPVLLPYVGNGKGLHVKGFLDEFKTVAERVANELNQVAQLGLPMVGLDASTTLCLQDEYRDYVATPLNYQVQLSHDWLCNVLPERANRIVLPSPEQPLQLLSHCTEQTQQPASAQRWRDIFAFWEIPLQLERTGCCGMAGTYGHESAHQQHSRQLYAMSWAEKVERDAISLATGFSCRSQVQRLSPTKRALHPLQWLAENCT